MNAAEIGLSTKASVLKEARAIATHHLGGQTASAKECILQGMFSRTIDVAMKDKTHYVVQLRSESVHEENAQQAHDILGDVVPVPVRVNREGSPVPFAYVMPRVPGSTWTTKDRGPNWPVANYVKVAGQIGDMIGRCCTPRGNSEIQVIDTLIIPRLQLYLAWDEPGVAPYKDLIRGLLERADELRKLPICFTHWDVNMMNIMVNDDADICGILDWEESYWMPLGLNVCRISELAAYNHRGVLSKRPYSDDMEKAFWKALFQAAPKGARGMLKEMQLAIDIGLVMTTFYEAKFPPHASHTGILNDTMATYKVPTDLSILVYQSYLVPG
jgi:Phosphotransferase enzyme family